MLPKGTLLQRRYRIEELLGQGGMSQVYLATHLGLARRVAIKMLQQLSRDPKEQWKFVERFQEEARILAALNHPNLAAIMDLFMDQQLPYLVMEFIQGRTLEAIVELAPRRLSQRRVLAWAAQLLDVLEYVHSRNPPVIVRDLKPANVMLGEDNRLRLIDFGLARLLTPGGRTQAIVKGMGSEGYAPLEQYGRATTDQRTDIYGLGGTLFFLLSGQHPPEAPSRVGQPDPPVPEDNPTVTREVWSAILKLMALYPHERPQNVAEARALLGLTSSEHRCVNCGARLHSELREGIGVESCPACGGCWLDRGEFEKLTRRA
ncbi:MAG: protein kinase [Candidatus Eremiobacterota bacterium]